MAALLMKGSFLGHIDPGLLLFHLICIERSFVCFSFAALKFYVQLRCLLAPCALPTKGLTTVSVTLIFFPLFAIC